MLVFTCVRTLVNRISLLSLHSAQPLASEEIHNYTLLLYYIMCYCKNIDGIGYISIIITIASNNKRRIYILHTEMALMTRASFSM